MEQTSVPPVQPVPSQVPVPPAAPAQVGGTYQPVGVAAGAPKHPGMVQGISGIICAVIALVAFPPFLGVAGIILGILAIRKGEKALGITALVLSAVFMLVGIALGLYVSAHPNLFKANNSSMSGAVIEALLQ